MSHKRRRKEIKIQEFMYRDTKYAEYNMYDYNGKKWSHQSNNKRLKEKFGIDTRKTFNRFTTKDDILGMSHIIWKVLQSET
jgi:hypothetical protein